MPAVTEQELRGWLRAPFANEPKRLFTAFGGDAEAKELSTFLCQAVDIAGPEAATIRLCVDSSLSSIQMCIQNWFIIGADSTEQLTLLRIPPPAKLPLLSIAKMSLAHELGHVVNGDLSNRKISEAFATIAACPRADLRLESRSPTVSLALKTLRQIEYAADLTGLGLFSDRSEAAACFEAFVSACPDINVWENRSAYHPKPAARRKAAQRFLALKRAR